jgi:chemotaxis protein methyltransferase CheR
MAAEGSTNPLFSSGFESLPMPEAAFKLLRDIIVEHTGVFFDDAKRPLLADKLSDLATEAGLTSFVEYYYLLRYDDNAELHWRRLMDRLAVPETFFWRQSEQFQTLAQTIAPNLLSLRGGKPLRIWSVACCSGEEPLSIAMALDEAGLLEPGKIEIIATDGSEAMIERARRAHYGPRSFRQLPDALRERYFTERSNGFWKPADRLMDAVSYGVMNLAEPDEIAMQPMADVIFCLNVFIYFADDAIRRSVESFSRRLCDDGYLFLGAAESLTRLGVSFELAEVGGSFVYVKPGRRAVVEKISAPVKRQR